jgi:hypothetical protein
MTNATRLQRKKVQNQHKVLPTLLSGLLVPAILAGLLAGLTGQVAYPEPLPFLTPLSPAETLTLESQNGNTPTYIEFVNNYGSTVVVDWINYTGQLVFYTFLESGASYVQQTYLTHPWIIYDQATGLPIVGFLPIAQEAEALIIKPAINDSQKRQCALDQGDNQLSAQKALESAQRTSGRLAASFALLAMVYQYGAISDGKCAIDPPDPDFMVIAVPDVSIPPPIKPGDGVTAAEASAFNALIRNLATATGVMNAAVTSANRALGAADAGSKKWLKVQSKKAQFFITWAENLAGKETTLATELCKALEAAGVNGDC